jgi:hypothetical protein
MQWLSENLSDNLRLEPSSGFDEDANTPSKTANIQKTLLSEEADSNKPSVEIYDAMQWLSSNNSESPENSKFYKLKLEAATNMSESINGRYRKMYQQKIMPKLVEKQKQYYDSEYDRKYYDTNAYKIAEKQKQYLEKNKREYIEKMSAKMVQRQKEYRERKRFQKQPEYQERNKREIRNRRGNRERNATSTILS